MTHDELLTKLNPVITVANITKQYHALRAVVELHKPVETNYIDIETCTGCEEAEYPCPTIQKIMDELK